MLCNFLPRSSSRRFAAIVAFAFNLTAILTLPGFAQMNTSSPVMEMKDEIPPEQLPTPQKMTGVGNVSMQITATPESQAWFNQGLNLLHDFWDYESAKAFEQAVRVDPQCAMCYWGLYRAESYYHSTEPDYAAVSLAKAVALEKHASKRERLYIDSDAAYVAAVKNGRNQAELLKSIDILRKLVKKYPKDTQPRIFLAWAVGGKEGRSLLEGVIKDDPENSAANHYYVHLIEGTDHPEQALHSANILASLAPASGHMVHMPGHIFYRLGDYARAEQAFDGSMRVDEAYMRQNQVGVDDDWNYVHNLMYAVANLLEEGKLKEATEYSAKLTGARGELDSTLYPFSARDSISRLNPELPVALRTGDWTQVIALSKAQEPPASQPNLRFLAGELATFGMGMRAVGAQKAQEYSAEFDAELWRMTQQMNDGQMARMRPGRQAAEPSAAVKAPAGSPKIPMMSDAYIEPLLRMLSVMSLELDGSSLEAGKQTAEAKSAFDRAQREEKALGYHEPPLYIRPVGETEAAALFAAGDFAGAKAAYQRALLERPRSGFPLYGIALCSEKQGDLAAATKEYSDFLTAWKDADSNLAPIEHARTYLAGHPMSQHSQAGGA